MGEKRYVALSFVLGFIVLSCIMYFGLPRVISPNISSNRDNELSYLQDRRNSIIKPTLSAYPEISGINITHNDNISLYAVSGDGQSQSSAYIIENISIVNPENNYSLCLYNVDDFLVIRNIQIFSSNIYSIFVAESSHVTFENITVQNDGTLEDYYFGIFFENCSSIIFSNMSLYDRTDVAIRYCEDFVFEDMIFFDISFYTISSIYYCQNITFLHNFFGLEVLNTDEIRRIRPYNCEDIIFKENYWENHSLYIDECENIEVLGNHFNNSALTVYESLFATIRNNSMMGGYISLSRSNNIIVDQNILNQSEGIRCYHSRDCLITQNDIVVNESVLYMIDKNTRIQFEQNMVVCNGEYVVEYDEYNKNEVRINVDLTITRNRFSGGFSYLYNIPNKATHFFALFTNLFPFNTLLCVNMLFICVFTIAIIFFLRYYSSDLFFTTPEREIIDIQKSKNLSIPIILGITLTILTSSLTTKNTLISSILLQWGVISENLIVLIHLILISFLWLTGLGIIILYLLKRIPKPARSVKNRELSKSDIIKAILIPLISTFLLYYPLQMMFLIYTRWSNTLFLSILLIIVGIGYRKDLKTIKISGMNIALFGILFLIDFVLCILFAVKQPIPLLLERPVGVTLGILLKIVYILIPTLSLVDNVKYQSEFHQKKNSDTTKSLEAS